MTVIINISNIIVGIIRILIIIVGADLLGIHSNRMSKSRGIFSLIAYISVSALDFLVINILDNPFGLFAVVLHIAKYLFPIIIACGRVKLRILYMAIFTDQAISFFSLCVSNVLFDLFNTPPGYVSTFVTLFIQVLIFSLLIVINKRSDSTIIRITLKIIPKNIFALLLLAVICLNAISSLVNFNTDNYKIKEKLLMVIIIALSVVLAFIMISLFLNVIAKQHFTAVSQMMGKQVELQISHYDNLEKMDAEMRKFRHDYTNHLRSILSLIRMHECSQAEEYIEKLQKTEYKSHMPMFYTGNRLADAILSEKSAALDEDCRIEYSGIIPSSIENVDLCIILSNALDNAIEAYRALQSQYTISIFAGKQQVYFVLSIKNPTVCSENFYEIPPTTKSDKTQHGMGLYNIESVVKKYNGQMKIKCENGVFELMITMKV